MRPYGTSTDDTQTETQEAQLQESPRSSPVPPLEDVRNLMLIASGWIIVLLILPPQHEYPIIDDWIYAGSVQHLLSTGTFEMPGDSQANLIGLTYWGAGWVKLLGFSFTALTYSTLFMSFVALFSFYGLARVVGTRPWAAMLGTGLLAYNPLFVHLSYSFMTDVPFIALMLLSCFCYILGLQGKGRYWLWIAGLLAGWAFLIRQFGAIIPVAFGLYLVLDMLLTRKLRIRDIIEVALVPAIIVVAWQIWTRDIPTTPTAARAAERASAFILKEPWLRVILLRSLVLLPLVALFSWAALKIRRTRWWLFALSAVVVLLVLFSVDLPDETWTQVGIPDYTAHLGPVNVAFSGELFTFGLVGNILRVDGIDFFQYPQQDVLTPDVWHAIWIVGVVLGVLLLAKFGDGLLDWLSERRRREPLSPLVAIYALGAIIFFISVAILGDLFDRYVLTVLPFVILFVVRGSATWGRIAWAYSLAGLALLFTFTVTAKADNIDHDNARWQAGQWVLARAGGVHVGFDFNNWMGQSSSDSYILADFPETEFNFRVDKQFPYFSRLGGFTTRYVDAESKSDAPPLTTLTPTP